MPGGSEFHDRHKFRVIAGYRPSPILQDHCNYTRRRRMGILVSGIELGIRTRDQTAVVPYSCPHGLSFFLGLIVGKNGQIEGGFFVGIHHQGLDESRKGGFGCGGIGVIGEQGGDFSGGLDVIGGHAGNCVAGLDLDNNQPPFVSASSRVAASGPKLSILKLESVCV